MHENQTIQLIGAASGIAASQPTCGDGPLVLEKSPYLAQLSQKGLQLYWANMIQPESAPSKLDTVTYFNQNLAKAVAHQVRQHHFFTVFGGDHSCAIGTWSGVASELKQLGDLGLIWIDAHLDSHTPETTQTGNIHGMPLATLLGRGHPHLTSIGYVGAKLKPEHVCVIGARSYEEEELSLMRELNVRVYFMPEVKERGLDSIMKEAISMVSKNTKAFGITIDIDSIDPVEAPGTGVSEPEGLSSTSLCHALRQLAGNKQLIGAEIVEFDPHLDSEQKTEKLIPTLLSAILLGQ